MSNRNAMLAKIHIAKKHLALEEESYRGLLHRVTGQESAANCSERQLNAVLAEFKSLGWNAKRKNAPARAGARRLHRENEAPKIRALWLSLYHLGEIRDPSEAALARYVARMTKDPAHPEGLEALQFLDARLANRVIKGLRRWCARVGFEQPNAEYLETVNRWRELAKLSNADIGLAAKMMLLESQWKKLLELGAFRFGAQAHLGAYLYKYFGASAPHFLDAPTADRAIERLGKWVRQAKAKAAS